MHFEITASVQSVGRQLNATQRGSSHFSEAPRIGHRTLRRGQVLKFSEADMKANEYVLKKLFEAHAIEIVQVQEGMRTSFRMSSEAGRPTPESPAPVEKAAPPPVIVPEPPPEPVTPPGGNEAFPTPEQVQETVEQENKQVESAPSHGKKNKRKE